MSFHHSFFVVGVTAVAAHFFEVDLVVDLMQPWEECWMNRD
jgi:hypothetical protein